MSHYIDAEKLTAFLTEAIETFASMENHIDPEIKGGNDRVSGALLVLQQVRAEIQSGRFAPEKS